MLERFKKLTLEKTKYYRSFNCPPVVPISRFMSKSLSQADFK
jgi:hypothetical protein